VLAALAGLGGPWSRLQMPALGDGPQLPGQGEAKNRAEGRQDGSDRGSSGLSTASKMTKG
jgi:hypothetical protein